MKRILTAAIALSLLGSAAASAQPRHDQNDRRQAQRDERRGDRADQRFQYGGRYFPRYHGPAYAYPRGFASRSWTRGQRLPPVYFGPRYYVDNWSYYHLAPPPRGYRYVRVGNDIVLAAIAGGLISQVIAGAFY